MSDDMVTLWDGSKESCSLVDSTVEALSYLVNDSQEAFAEVVEFAREDTESLSELAQEKAEYVRLLEDGRMDDSVRNIILNSVVEDCTHDLLITYPVVGDIE